MTSRLTHVARALCAAVLGGLVTLAVTATHSRPAPLTLDQELERAWRTGQTTPSTTPHVGVWYVACPPDGWGWGPYSSPDACRSRLELTRRICTHPLRGPNHPDPDFVQLAALCRDAYNGIQCRCVLTDASSLASP